MASSRKTGLKFNFTRLAIALKKIGHEIILVSEPKEEENGLFKTLKLSQVKYYKVYGLDNPSIRNTISAARAIRKIIDESDIDVIHIQGIRHLIVASLASNFFFHKKKIGIVASIHTTGHGTPYENITLLVESLLLNLFCDLAMPVANSVANELINFGLFPKKVTTIYNGIDLNLFDEIILSDEYLNLLPAKLKSSSYIVVGYFASMIPRKGHKYLIKAISEISKEFPKIRLILSSDGPLRDEIKKLSINLGIEDKVHFTGKIEYKYLYQFLKRIDIYAFPSLAELFPYAILEAMAAKKAIVATNIAGIPEAITHMKSGLLVPSGSSEDLYNAIKSLIINPKLAKELGANARSTIENRFEINSIAEQLTDTYTMVLMK